MRIVSHGRYEDKETGGSNTFSFYWKNEECEEAGAGVALSPEEVMDLAAEFVGIAWKRA